MKMAGVFFVVVPTCNLFLSHFCVYTVLLKKKGISSFALN